MLTFVGLVAGQVVGILVEYWAYVFYFIPDLVLIAIAGYLSMREFGRARAFVSADIPVQLYIINGIWISLAYELVRLRFNIIVDLPKFVGLGIIALWLCFVLTRAWTRPKEQKAQVQAYHSVVNKTCATCGGNARFIEQYSKHYCDKCMKYID